MQWHRFPKFSELIGKYILEIFMALHHELFLYNSTSGCLITCTVAVSYLKKISHFSYHK